MINFLLNFYNTEFRRAGLATIITEITRFIGTYLIKDLRYGSIQKSDVALSSIMDVKDSWTKLVSE